VPTPSSTCAQWKGVGTIRHVICLRKGRSVEARFWAIKAAEQGYPQAQHCLAYLHLPGVGTCQRKKQNTGLKGLPNKDM